MTKKKLTKSATKSYSPFEKRKIVEEVRSGFYSFAQARKKYILSKTKFSKWNRWYFKTRLLPHFKPKKYDVDFQFTNAMTIKYLFLWILSFATVTWILIKALRKSYFPPHNDDDGGTPVDINLPIYDPPSGNGLECPFRL